MFKKENLSVLKKESLTISNDNKYKSATGTHSTKSNCKVSSAKQIESLTSNSNKDIIITEDIIEHREQNLDNKKIDTSNLESGTKDKV